MSNCEECENLRMKLAGCGVAALANTEESIKNHRIDSTNPYWCASYQDVCNAVDREMALRNENQELRELVKEAWDIIHYYDPKDYGPESEWLARAREILGDEK